MFNSIRRFFSNIITPPQFIVTITNGKAAATFRKVTKSFLNECDEICKNNGLAQGKIYGINCEYGVRLEFSDKISKEHHQKFRNVWNLVK
jgi:Protein of unknown function (DUF3634)